MLTRSSKTLNKTDQHTSNRADNTHKSISRTCGEIVKAKPIDTQVIQRLQYQLNKKKGDQEYVYIKIRIR